jgi:CRP/FNR family transcriptional regulator, cyclic AMP receptor protein
VDRGRAAHSICHLLSEDTDLAEVIPAARRSAAIDELIVPELALSPGPWKMPASLQSDAIGFLVLKGLILRRVSIEGRCAIELIGECDVIRPWQQEEPPMLSLEAGWVVLEPTRLAALDGRFTRQLGRYPELAGRLFERAIRRSRQLVVNMAIVHQARVDDRLYMLFLHLAGRWGRVRGDGVFLRLRLTHTVLADLVSARRPTVTSALSDLARRGLVQALDDGWLLPAEAAARSGVSNWNSSEAPRGGTG